MREKGNQVAPLLADALKDSKVAVHLRFVFCNLNASSVQLLARALELNSTLIGFTILWQGCCPMEPYHLLSCKTYEALFRARILTQAPLEIWNNRPVLTGQDDFGDDDIGVVLGVIKKGVPIPQVVEESGMNGMIEFCRNIAKCKMDSTKQMIRFHRTTTLP